MQLINKKIEYIIYFELFYNEVGYYLWKEAKKNGGDKKIELELYKKPNDILNVIHNIKTFLTIYFKKYKRILLKQIKQYIQKENLKSKEKSTKNLYDKCIEVIAIENKKIKIDPTENPIILIKWVDFNLEKNEVLFRQNYPQIVESLGEKMKFIKIQKSILIVYTDIGFHYRPYYINEEVIL